MPAELNAARCAANIPKYYAYAVFKGLHFGLVAATWVIFLQRQHGLSLAQITLVDVAFWVSVTLGEVPTGVVADTYGRKVSLAVGTALMAASLFAWSYAPTVPLIILAYAALALGVTFLSGAEDAFFFESIQKAGRSHDYTRLVGRATAVVLAAAALGNVAGGLLATVDLRWPSLAAAALLVVMWGVVLTFHEPEQAAAGEVAPPRRPYTEVLGQALAQVRARPRLRYAMLFLAFVPMTAMILETVFVQPQALALGLPLAGIGVVVMGVQFANMAGAASAHRMAALAGDGRMLVLGPLMIIAALLGLAAWQVLPALGLIGVVGFATAALRPLVMNRIQQEAPDAVRATVISLQSLLFTLLAAVVEPSLGLIADRAGFPTTYRVMALGLALASLILWWRGGRYLAAAQTAAPVTGAVAAPQPPGAQAPG